MMKKTMEMTEGAAAALKSSILSSGTARNVMTAAYSAAHFFVDLACAFIMFRFIYMGTEYRQALLFYNFCAFALQMPLGALLDRLGMGHAAAGLGCLMIAAACPVSVLPGGWLMAAVIMGIGNSLFHLGGGVYVLDEYDSSGALGVFVSPGAVGLYLGTVWGSGGSVSTILPIGAMIFWGAAFFLLPGVVCPGKGLGSPAPCGASVQERLSPIVTAAAAMFTAVVVIRSFGGFALHPDWKTGAWVFPAVLATAGGKAAGGFLSDRFGRVTVSAVTMGVAGVLFIFSENIPACLPGLLLFNMSMPITLRAAADIFRDGRGFSFGLLTFALFLGYIPVYSLGNPEISGGAMCLLCFVSGVLLVIGFRLSQGRTEGKRV